MGKVPEGTPTVPYHVNMNIGHLEKWRRESGSSKRQRRRKVHIMLLDIHVKVFFFVCYEMAEKVCLEMLTCLLHLVYGLPVSGHNITLFCTATKQKNPQRERESFSFILNGAISMLSQYSTVKLQ